MNGPPRPGGTYYWAISIAAAVALSVAALDWNLEVFSSLSELQRGADRLLAFLGSFGAPDLSPEMLHRGLHLALETLAVALLGVALGVLLGYPIALGASRSVVLGDLPPGRRGRLWRRAVVEACRLLLDVLRGVPDFAWAVMVALFTGISPVTGILAIGISVAGILGKIYSEQWDAVDPSGYTALRSTGAGNLTVFLFGIQPLAARAMLSYTLMRTECAVRNASVIGVVGGGGLGSGLWDEFADQNYDNVVTLLLFMLLLTASADVLANLLRYHLRIDPNHPRAPRDVTVRASTGRRAAGIGGVVLVLAGSLWYLRAELAWVLQEITRLDWGYVGRFVGGLATPDLGLDCLGAALAESRVPLALGLLATVASVALAGAMAYPASIAFQMHSHRFSGEAVSAPQRVLRALLILTTRAAGMVLRGVPEVAWLMILGTFFKAGTTAGVLAISLHSAGVLLRVFAESIDNVSYRGLEQVGTGRFRTFLYGALPVSWSDWRTYAMFQFEVNVRIGVVLGMVGLGGLGHAFEWNLEWSYWHRASTYLLAMVLLTVLIDRSSRALGYRRLRC